MEQINETHQSSHTSMFEIKFKFSTKIGYEFKKKLGFKRKMLCLLLLLYYVIMFYTFKSNSYENNFFANSLYSKYTLLILFLAVSIFYLDIIYIISLVINKGIKYNDESRVINFSDKIKVSEGDTHKIYDYSEIVKIIYLKNSTALMLDKKEGIVFDNKSFTKGHLDNFKKFINGKIDLTPTEEQKLESRKLIKRDILYFSFLILFPILIYIVLIYIPSMM